MAEGWEDQRGLIDKLGCGVVVRDIAGRLLYTNPAAEQFFGPGVSRLKGTMAGWNGWTFMDADGAPVPPDELPAPRVLRTHQPDEARVFAMEAESGQRRWVETKCVPILNTQGAFEGTVTSFIDVTERLLAESKLRHLYDAMACGVVVRNQEGRVISVNRAGVALLGEEKHGFLGTSGITSRFTVLDESGGQIEEMPFQQVLRTAQEVRNRVLLIKRTSSPEDLWLQVDATPVLSADGHLEEVVSSFVDITAQKEAERSQRQVAEQSKRLALLQERERIAIELHDGVIQSLYALSLFLSGAESSSKEARRRFVSRAGSQIDGIVQSIRNYIFHLQPRDASPSAELASDSDVTAGEVGPVRAPDLHAAVGSAIAPVSTSNPTTRHSEVTEVMLQALKPRERQILQLIAEGNTNREIAAALALSEHTIRTYVSKLFRKLNIGRRSEAAALATRHLSVISS